MKINVKYAMQGYLFEDIKAGEVFYSEVDPYCYLLRTDNTDNHSSWAAVDIESGVMYDYDDFNHDNAQYHIVEAEVTLS